MLLQLTDGTTTVVLSGTSPVRGATYFPATPSYSANVLQPVTETAEVNLTGTQTAIRATINSIETLLRRGLERQATGAGERVFVEYKPVDTDSAAYRSEVLDGRVQWSADPGLRRLGDNNPTVRVAVIWTRAPWWEGPEAELQLSANGQGAATGGRTTYNDPANGNWVQVAAAQIAGNLPAPIRLQLMNTAGASKNFRRVFVGVNAFSDPDNLVHFLQGEARISGGSVDSDAAHSGGQALEVTLSGTPTAYSWTLPQADLQRTKGRRFRLLLRTPGATGSLYVQPQIRTTAGTLLWTGDELPLTTPIYESWQDLGIVPLPPGGYSGGSAQLRLALALRGSGVALLDVLQLTALDDYLHMELPGVGMAIGNNEAIVHDSIERLVYHLSGSVHAPLSTAFGGELLLQPGVNNRLYILHQLNAAQTGGAGDAPIGNTLSVRAYYRPRRVTV
jgi:hypothetical protein